MGKGESKGAESGGKPSAAESEERMDQHTWGHTIAFGEEYYLGALKILQDIRDNEMPLIADVSARIAATLEHGGNVWMQAKQGHMPRFEFDPANKGNPGLLQSNADWDDSDYDRMRAGDVLVTNYVNENVMKAKEGGVYVVGVTVPYQDDPRTPRGFMNPHPNGWWQSDVSNVVIDSHVPYTQGIVTCPQIPEMKIAPSSASALTAIFWMLQAESANRFKNPSSTGSAKAAVVIETAIERVKSAYSAQREAVFRVAAVVAEKIGVGSHYHVTSDHGGVQSEATGTANGPMMTNAFRKEMKSGDVHLLASIEPDSGKILAEAAAAREMGMYVVSIAPGTSERLRVSSHALFDNLSPEGGGLVEVEGFDKRIGVVGGILNNIIMWILTAQFVDEMVRRGWVPWFWMGFHQVGGREYDDAVRPFFLKQGF